MIVIPKCARSLVVGILEYGGAGLPGDAPLIEELGSERIISGTFNGKACGNVVCRGQKPRFGKAVALLSAVSPVEVRYDRHWTGIRLRRGGERRPHVPVSGASRRVGPMKGRIHRQEVWEEIAGNRIFQVIDPLDPRWLAPVGFDRESRIVECTGVVGRTVTPHGCLRQRWR